MTASSLRWPLFALVGLLVAIVVAVLATQMVSEKIGITSEPISAGRSLSPQHAHRAKSDRQRSSDGSATASQTNSIGSGNPGGIPATSVPSSSVATPSGGGSDDSSRSHSGDD